MPKVQYVGPSHIREISKKDFAGVKVEQEGIKVVREDIVDDYVLNPDRLENTAEVSQETADYLLKAEKDQWKLVKEDAPATTTTTTRGGTTPPVA